MKKKNIFKAVYGTSGVLEGLVTLVKCYGALALRALILTTSGHCLIDSIKKVCPALYRKNQRA